MSSDNPISDTQEPVGAPRHPASPSTSAQTRDVVEEGKEVVHEMSDQMKDIAENQMHELTQQLRGIVSALDAASMQLEEQEQRNLSEQVDTIADALDRFCERLSSGSLKGVAEDARGWATENPTGFFGGSVALGFALSRLLKASSGESTSSRGRGQSDYPSATAEEAYEGVDDGR